MAPWRGFPDNSALTMKSFDAGSVKAWVDLLATHPNWQEVDSLDANYER